MVVVVVVCGVGGVVVDDEDANDGSTQNDNQTNQEIIK